MQANLEKRISDSVSRLNISQKRRILSFIETISTGHGSKTKKNPLLQFACAISTGDLKLMEDAINESCENIEELRFE